MRDARGNEMRDVVTLKSFDFRAGETPENLVVLTDGAVCATLLLAKTVWRSTGDEERVVANDPDAMGVGLAADADDRLYVAVRSASSDIAGIWRRESDGRWARFAVAETGTGLNGITFDDAGALFAADSVNGRILWLPPGERALRLWLDDVALKPTAPNDPVSSTGVNGLKMWRGALYATNTAQATVLRIDLEGEKPGAVTRLHASIPADDFAFDVDGHLYLAVHPRNTVERIARDGSRTVLATADDGLDGPTAVAVVEGGLLVTNMGILGTTHAPSLMRISTTVGAPALPRPRMHGG
jgi:sugar lactone lactonase YvrE